MSKCLKCKIEVSDGMGICPLCRCALEAGENKEERLKYPAIGKKKEKMRNTLSIYFIGAVAAYALLGFLNRKTQAAVRWDIIVGAALLYGYMTLFISLMHKTGYRLRMLLQTLGGIGLIVVIDGVLGFQKWSLAYVLPGALVLLDIAVVILMLANGRNWQSYIPVEILILVLSLIPSALYQAGIAGTPYGSFGCFGAALCVLAGTVVIGRRRAAAELKRRFHV